DKGKVGGALHLVPEKGKNAVLDFGAFPELSNEFTISFWAISERDNLKTAFFHAKGDNDKEFWRLNNSHNSSKTPNYSKLIFDGIIGTPIRIEGHWTHFVIAYSKTGEFKKLYVDGWLAASGPNLPMKKDATGTPQLIFNNTGDNYSFEGMIDEVAIYDKMLNNDEVHKIYTGGVKSLEKRVPVDPHTTLAYTQDFIKKVFPEPKTTYQTKNFAEDRFEGSNLPPYTHPRLNLTMEDLPRIRQSFLKSQQGNNNNSFMYHYSRTHFGQNLENYTPNTIWKEGAKDPLSDPRKNVILNSGPSSNARMSLAYEALMTADSKLARILIENMIKSAEVQQPLIDQGLKKGLNGWQGWYHDILGRRCTQIMYDYLYNWMTEAEKKQIRKVIAGATAGNWSIGMYAMPALYANRSNWQAWITGDMMIALQSIYGEDGFSQFTYDHAARAVNACAEIMNDPESGAHYEGMGKSSINATQMSVLSRMQPKGKKVISSKAIYNNVAKFHLHIGLPWTNKKVMYDQKNGGNAGIPPSSVNVLHYAYPDDPVLNYLKHCIDDGASSYTSMRPRTFGQESWMISAVYNQDWTGPKDLQKHLKYAAEKAGEPLGYFSDFRGQMVSRSSWEPDALQLNYVARVIKGGHHAPVKGYFVVNGLERQWIEFRSRANHHTRMNSCVTVDGDGQDGTVARSLAYSGAAKTKGALFDILSSELTGGYRQINNKWPNLNYTRLKPDPRPWFDMPKQYLTHWYLGDRPYAPLVQDYDKFDPENYKGKKEFAYAYRSAAFARGTHPYILIVDDFKKDDKEREYIWHAALTDDLKQNMSVHKLSGDTAILTDPKDSTKHLLVKMFGYEGKGEFVIEHVLPTQDVDRAKMNLTTEQMPHNLKFKCKTSTAKFRTMIYAFRDGDPMPQVTGKDGVHTITIGDQVDELTTSKEITIQRKKSEKL
ncbi:MAG: LamG domain-containing protein, partial [Chloroflexi bacterium]|nr:LamG domain-containing protein [Chloroflexota bacterium]